jgi:hypothetical protein
VVCYLIAFMVWEARPHVKGMYNPTRRHRTSASDLETLQSEVLNMYQVEACINFTLQYILFLDRLPKNYGNRGHASATFCSCTYISLALQIHCMLARLLSSPSRRYLYTSVRRMAESSAAKPKSASSHSLCRTVVASEVANPYTNEIKQAIESSSSSRPKLVGFLCGKKDSPSVTYADWTKKACEAVGIEYELRIIDTEGGEMGEDMEQASVGGAALGAADLETAILEANVDSCVLSNT